MSKFYTHVDVISNSSRYNYNNYNNCNNETHVNNIIYNNNLNKYVKSYIYYNVKNTIPKKTNLCNLCNIYDTNNSSNKCLFCIFK